MAWRAAYPGKETVPEPICGTVGEGWGIALHLEFNSSASWRQLQNDVACHWTLNQRPPVHRPIWRKWYWHLHLASNWCWPRPSRRTSSASTRSIYNDQRDPTALWRRSRRQCGPFAGWTLPRRVKARH